MQQMIKTVCLKSFSFLFWKHLHICEIHSWRLNIIRLKLQGHCEHIKLNSTRTFLDMDRTLKFVNYKVGGTQKTCSLSETKCFFYSFKWKWDDPIWYFSCLCRKFSELKSFAFSELYSKKPKSEIYPKMPKFEQLEKQVTELKNVFGPSLERSWHELVGIRKAHGPKNQPPSRPRV